MPDNYCSNCGNVVQPKDLFCQKCGSPVDSKTTTEKHTQPAKPKEDEEGLGHGSRRRSGYGAIIVLGIGMLLIAAAIVSNALLNGPSTKQSATKTAAAWTATPIPAAMLPLTPTPTAMLPPTPTQESISAEVQAEANQSFAHGALVYLYDPQPKTVSRSDLATTEFSIHYILSKDAKAETNVLLILRVNAKGAYEPMIPMRGYLEDWTSETGVLTINAFRFVIDITRQQHVDDPNAMVFIAFIGMTPLYVSPIQQHVDDPLYLSISLVAPEESEGNLILSDSSSQLSNILQIDVTP